MVNECAVEGRAAMTAEGEAGGQPQSAVVRQRSGGMESRARPAGLRGREARRAPWLGRRLNISAKTGTSLGMSAFFSVLPALPSSRHLHQSQHQLHQRIIPTSAEPVQDEPSLHTLKFTDLQDLLSQLSLPVQTLSPALPKLPGLTRTGTVSSAWPAFLRLRDNQN